MKRWRGFESQKTRLLQLILCSLLLAMPIAIYSASKPQITIQDLEVVSLGTGSLPAAGSSFFVVTSENARYITFESLNQNFPGDSYSKDNWVDIFFRDRFSDKTVKVSRSVNGGLTNESSYDPMVTADGRYVSYFSFASNIIADDTNGHMWTRDGLDVFLYDVQSAKNQRVSLDSEGKEIDGNSVGLVTPDGRYILFVSNGHVIRSEPHKDKQSLLYLRNWRSGTIEQVSVSKDGGYPDAEPSYPSSSFDARYIVYSSEATNLVPKDTNGEKDIFLYDRQSRTTKRVSLSSFGDQTNGPSSKPQISYDGRYIVYHSSASNLVSGDTNGVDDIFLYDVATGLTRRINLGPNGEQADGLSKEPSICGDGRYVSYTTEATNIVPGDKNKQRDVIVYDVLNDVSAVATINADGQWGDAKAHRSFMVPDCRAVAFASEADNLVAGDDNGKRDIILGQIITPADLRRSSVDNPAVAQPGETVHYQIRIINDGRASVLARLDSSIPQNTTYVGGSVSGGATYDPAGKQIQWEGVVHGESDLTIGFSLIIDPGLVDPTVITSQSTLSGDGQVHTLNTVILVNGLPFYLPLMKS